MAGCDRPWTKERAEVGSNYRIVGDKADMKYDNMIANC